MRIVYNAQSVFKANRLLKDIRVVYTCLLIFVPYFTFCKSNNRFNQENCPVTIVANLDINPFQFKKDYFGAGDHLELPVFSITNSSEIPLVVRDVKVEIKDLSNQHSNFDQSFKLTDEKVILNGKSEEFGGLPVCDIPDRVNGVFGVFVKCNITALDSINYKLADSSVSKYVTFFRVTDMPEKNTYNIEDGEYKGVPVFELSRGLSAEYSVQKAIASLNAGIAHSWAIPLEPVQSTPAFLEKSINKTIGLYNKMIGSDQPIETVVISTGIPSAAYLANVMHAPVLPLHFLTGAGTVKEIESILNYSGSHGYSCYATLGHDYSISDSVGVAWIKLLDIPDEYLKFIQRHQVKNVIMLGYSGSSGGEIQARKVVDNKPKYAAGSIYLMYFAGNDAERYLKQVIRDFDEVPKDNLVKIADWESGIIPEQVDHFSRTIKDKTSVNNIHLLTSEDDVALWKLGTWLMAAYMKKNQDKYEGSALPQGISFNPYLIGHPFFESRMGYLPLLYWQGNNPQNVVDGFREAVSHYFPTVDLKSLTCWINSSRNFGGAVKAEELIRTLKTNGFSNLIVNNFEFDEVWSPKDGMNSPVEMRLERMLQKSTSVDLKQWKGKMVPLNDNDLADISKSFPQIEYLKQ